jgi:hypothetical protein
LPDGCIQLSPGGVVGRNHEVRRLFYASGQDREIALKSTIKKSSKKSGE